MSLADRPQNRSFHLRASVGKAKKYAEFVATYEASPKLCKKCSGPLTFRQRKNQFCSLRCHISTANRRTKRRLVPLTEEERLARKRLHDARSRTKKRGGRPPRVPRFLPPKAYYTSQYDWTPVRSCADCGRFHRETAKKYCSACSPNIRHYRSRASFKFNVYEYPDEFDLNLVTSLGWYSPTGRNGKNRTHLNLNGASRDHLFTVSDGFHLGVDPTLLAHPANCEVVSHAENSSKARRRSRITLEELHRRIAEWETKYGKCPPHRSVKSAPSE